jgi:hypothetical protein
LSSRDEEQEKEVKETGKEGMEKGEQRMKPG